MFFKALRCAKEELKCAAPLNSPKSTNKKQWRKSNEEVYSEYNPVEQKRYKKQPNDQ